MMIARRLKGWLLAGGLLLTAPAWAVAAGLKVESHGDHGRPIILVPGLGGGAWVWQDTARALQDGHKVYVVTLPGFDGTPPPAGGNAMDQAEAALIALMRARHLDKPVLVGHSLGGTLALKIASEHPQLLGGVVAVDGLPVFPGSENLPPAQRQAMAASMQTQLQSATPAQFLAQQIAYMRRIGVLDEAKAELYGKFNARSDSRAMAQYMAEDFRLDLRDALKRADLPVLEISPYNPPDFAAGPMAMSERQKTDYYRSLLANAPHVQVVSISPARHFVMLDQPEKFRQTLIAFIDAL